VSGDAGKDAEIRQLKRDEVRTGLGDRGAWHLK